MKRFLSLLAVLCLLSSTSVVCGETTWNLVTDAANLNAGDQIIIASATEDFALSTTQNANNRGQAEIVKTDNQCTLSSDVQVITLQEGTLPNTLALFVGDGYLYAASKTGNYLRTQAENNANGSFVIDIDENGVATIMAQGENTHNYLRYNSGSDLFSCYENATGNVSIYKAVVTASYTITYNENGTTSEQQCADDESVTLKMPEEINGFAFQGWSLNPMSSPSDTPPAMLPNPYVVTDDVTLYAVFAIEKNGYFEKVITPLDDYSGTYLIVNEENMVAFNGGLESLDVNENNIEVDISDGVIMSNVETNSAVFTISKTTAAYSIRSSSGFYIGRTSGTAGLNANQTTVYDNFIDIDEEGNAVVAASDTIVLRYNSTSGQKRFRYYKGTQKAIQLYKRGVCSTRCYCTSIDVISSPLAITENTVWTTPTSLADVVTVSDNAKLSGNMIGNKNADLLVIDGGQIECNEGVFGTFVKEIDASSEWGMEYLATDGWYGISSPVAGNVEATAVSGLLTSGNNNFDLYLYSEQEASWLNYKNEENNFTNLNSGEGYLYASKEGTTLRFCGELNTNDIEKTISYSSENEMLKGFNLLGNPFPKSITLADVEGADFSGFCLATDAGAWEVHVGNADEIGPGEAFLIQTDETKPVVIRNDERTKRNAETYQNIISVKVENNKYSDVAHAILLPSAQDMPEMSKFPHQNDAIPSLSINDKAIAVLDENVGSFTVSLDVATTGTYKMSVNVDDAAKEVTYLHLVDLQTNCDIDMLVEKYYEFIGSPVDDKDRFIIKMFNDNNVDDNEENDGFFIYQTSNMLVTNAIGKLQIFDMMGRVVMSCEVDCNEQTINVEGIKHGAYIVRIVGEKVRTQKIVIM